jgi:hypothetical protein
MALGLALRNVGRVGMSPGRSAMAALSAAWTSRAAPAMERERSNCSAMRDEPSPDVEVISVTPGISPRRRSRGAAMVAAMVMGSAPGRLALTRMVGISTVGREATGRKRKATKPASSSPIDSNVVPTGRWMKGREKLTLSWLRSRDIQGVTRSSWRSVGMTELKR